MKQTLTSTPEEDVLNQLKAKVAALESRASDIREEIKLRETRRDDANIIKAKHNGYQRQSVYDDADIICQVESKAIGQLRHELNELNIELSQLQRPLSNVQKTVNEQRIAQSKREVQRQYEAHTVTSTQANITMYQKSYNELKAKLDNVNAEIVKLNKQADSHADDVESCEVLKTSS